MVGEVLAMCQLCELPRHKWPEFLQWMRLMDMEFLAFCAEKRQKSGK